MAKPGTEGNDYNCSKDGKMRTYLCNLRDFTKSEAIFSLQEESFKGKCVIDFLKQIERNHPNKKNAVVMDNAPCRKSKVMKEYLEKS